MQQFKDKNTKQINDFADRSCTFGIINPWPGDKSAEAEVLTRMQKAANNIGIKCIFLDNFGFILDNDNQKKTLVKIDPKGLDFVITTHYESPKTIDTFYYHALWNPPEIPLNLDYYEERVTKNYIMNDDFLIYDSGGMKNHLQGMLINKPRNLDNASMLTASVPESEILTPNLDEPLLFYCGMNWEKLVHNTNRHEGLFKLLDDTGKVKFFGPDVVEAWGGLRPWEGYKCYQYSIPFDGFSILREINKCGVSLVLSSDIHRRAGAATNKTYEACAAGAVMICDENEFMLKHFRDAAIFIKYNKNNPEDTFKQIMEKYEWIIANKAEAIELAHRAQEIFKNKFSLEKQLTNLVHNHPKRCAVVANELFAPDTDKLVMVMYVCDTLDIQKAQNNLNVIINNISNQLYSNIMLVVAADNMISENLAAFCADKNFKIKVVPLKMFDSNSAIVLTKGQAIKELRTIPHDYFMITNSNEIWFYDHVTTLVRTMYDKSAACVHSGRNVTDAEGLSHIDLFDQISWNMVYYMEPYFHQRFPGIFLFDAKCHEYVPDYLFDCLDGLEHYAYLNLILLKHCEKVHFSERMTFSFYGNEYVSMGAVVSMQMQVRFIRDLVKYDLPLAIGTSSGEDFETQFKKMLMKYPLKGWLKLRYYRFRARRAKNSNTRNKYTQMYEELLRQYLGKW